MSGSTGAAPPADGGGPTLAISDLTVDFATDEGTVHAVHGVSLEVRRGEVLALVGESGSGKSVTSLAVMGLLPPTARVTGQVLLGGEDLLGRSQAELRALRGRRMSMVFQEPMTALNPTLTVGRQLAEAVRNHTAASRQDALTRAVDLLDQVDVPDPHRRVHAYPHELSGGQRQRVMIAMALAHQPQLIIADEPTTALDVTVQAGILDLLRTVIAGTGAAMLLVTHNMGVVADIAQRVAVMRDGDLLEVGDVRQVLGTPTHDYSRHLLDAIPKLPPAQVVAGEQHSAGSEQADNLRQESEQQDVARRPVASRPAGGEDPPPPDGPSPDDPPDQGAAVLELAGVSVEYGRRGAAFRAVRDVDLQVRSQEIVGLVGESGSGKSTLGHAALGLLGVSGGQVRLFGQPLTARGLGRRQQRELRRRVGVIFQDPAGSLDPRMTVAECVAEPMVVHRRHSRYGSRAAREARVRELLDGVRLPADTARRYPHELSGGQRQRVSIARAIALDPGLLVADEPTSALDVSVQAHVLDVLRELQARYEFACLFISHDLAVVHSLAHRVAVMHQGQIVELGDREQILRSPRHDYSRRLLGSVPVADPDEQARRRVARQQLLGTVA